METRDLSPSFEPVEPVKSALRLACNQGLDADFVHAEQVLTWMKADNWDRCNVSWRAVPTRQFDAEDPRAHAGEAFQPK